MLYRHDFFVVNSCKTWARNKIVHFMCCSISTRRAWATAIYCVNLWNVRRWLASCGYRVINIIWLRQYINGVICVSFSLMVFFWESVSRKAIERWIIAGCHIEQRWDLLTSKLQIDRGEHGFVGFLSCNYCCNTDENVSNKILTGHQGFNELSGTIPFWSSSI